MSRPIWKIYLLRHKSYSTWKKGNTFKHGWWLFWKIDSLKYCICLGQFEKFTYLDISPIPPEKKAIRINMGDDYFEKSIHLNTVYVSANWNSNLLNYTSYSTWKKGDSFKHGWWLFWKIDSLKYCICLGKLK